MPKLIETLSFVRSLRKDAQGGNIQALSDFQKEQLARHIENIEASVQKALLSESDRKFSQK